MKKEYTPSNTQSSASTASYDEAVRHLQESERRFHAMFEQANVGIAFETREGMFIDANRHYCEIVDHSRDELLQLSFRDITYEEDWDATQEQLNRLWGGDPLPGSVEKRYRRKDGSLVWARTTFSLIRNEDGTPSLVMAVMEDISAWKQAQEERAQLLAREQMARTEAQAARAEAQQRAQQLEAVFETISDGVYVYDETGRIVQTNSAMREIFGFYESAEFFALPVQKRIEVAQLCTERGEILPSEESPIQRILRGEVLQGLSALDVIVQRTSEKEMHLNVTGAPLRDEQGRIVGGVSVLHDVTERWRLERRTHRALEGLLSMAEALVQLPEDASITLSGLGQQLVELMRSVTDCQRVSVHIVERDTGIIRPLAVIGLTPEQEPTWWEEQSRQDSSINERMNAGLMQRLKQNEVLVFDARQYVDDSMAQSYGLKTMLLAPLSIGERLLGLLMLDYGGEEHIYTPEERSLVSAVAKLSALVMERQRLLYERAEAQGREMALREANALMEEFLGIASHELRTPLTTIKANVQLAIRRLIAVQQQGEQFNPELSAKINATYDMLRRAERQVGVLNRLVGDMIDISRIQSGKLQIHLCEEPVDLVPIVQEVVQEACKATPNRTIHFFYPEHAEALVRVDDDRIGQVLTNYLSNALKYSEADKPVDVRLTIEQYTVQVAVQDQGPGLSPEAQQRIWECFYQEAGIKVLSGSGVGLGLGLHISKTIVDLHHGRVGVQSHPGEGSTFWFILPLAERRAG